MNLILSPYFKLKVPFNLKFLWFLLPRFFKNVSSFVAWREKKKIQTENNEKKSHTKNIYCFFDWFMYIKTYFCEGKNKNGRREILHTDTCDLPFLYFPNRAQANRHLYLESWEFISYLLSGVCLFCLWLELYNIKAIVWHDIKCTQRSKAAARQQQQLSQRHKKGSKHSERYQKETAVCTSQCQGWIAFGM